MYGIGRFHLCRVLLVGWAFLVVVRPHLRSGFMVGKLLSRVDEVSGHLREHRVLSCALRESLLRARRIVSGPDGWDVLLARIPTLSRPARELCAEWFGILPAVGASVPDRRVPMRSERELSQPCRGGLHAERHRLREGRPLRQLVLLRARQRLCRRHLLRQYVQYAVREPVLPRSGDMSRRSWLLSCRAVVREPVLPGRPGLQQERRRVLRPGSLSRRQGENVGRQGRSGMLRSWCRELRRIVLRGRWEVLPFHGAVRAFARCLRIPSLRLGTMQRCTETLAHSTGRRWGRWGADRR